MRQNTIQEAMDRVFFVRQRHGHAKLGAPGRLVDAMFGSFCHQVFKRYYQSGRPVSRNNYPMQPAGAAREEKGSGKKIPIE
jgi:hypothetical protein